VPLFENRAVYKIMWKDFMAGQDTSDNMAPAHCMLDTQDHRHTLRMRNMYRLSTTTVVARTRLNITL